MVDVDGIREQLRMAVAELERDLSRVQADLSRVQADLSRCRGALAALDGDAPPLVSDADAQDADEARAYTEQHREVAEKKARTVAGRVEPESVRPPGEPAQAAAGGERARPQDTIEAPQRSAPRRITATERQGEEARAAAVEIVRRAGEITQAEAAQALADERGIHYATAANHFREAVRRGLLERTGEERQKASGAGRPSPVLRVAGETFPAGPDVDTPTAPDTTPSEPAGPDLPDTPDPAPEPDTGPDVAPSEPAPEPEPALPSDRVAIYPPSDAREAYVGVATHELIAKARRRGWQPPRGDLKRRDVLAVLVEQDREGIPDPRDAHAKHAANGSRPLADRVASALADKSGSPKEIADRLGAQPSDVARHLRELVKAGKADKFGGFYSATEALRA